METNDTAPPDDGVNQGTVDAPSPDDRAVNQTDSQSNPSGTQKRTKTDVSNNPLATDRRRWNPLTKFSSFTYNITLYMVTPECANYYADNGTLPDNADDGGYYIIAQSGGINSQAEPRLLTTKNIIGVGQEGLDFYIDDLNLKMYMIGQDRQRTATAAVTISFKVTEPTGFTFLTKLSQACQAINKKSKLISSGNANAWPNLYQQHYIVGVRFYGYDENGELVKAEMVDDAGSFNSYDKFAVYERFFPFIGSKVSTKLTGRATEYLFEGTFQNLQAAFGAKRGKLPTNSEFEGSTVGDILGSMDSKNDKSMIVSLNNIQSKEKVDEKRILAQKFNIEWLEDAEKIKNSPLLTDADYSKEISAMSIAKNVKEVNAATSVVSNTANTTTVIKGFSADTPIVLAIDQIIVKSKYVVDTLIKKINSNIEGDTQTETKGLLQWYCIHPVTTIEGRDSVTKDWAYNITYQIKPYHVPYLKSQYAPARTKYYGPIKKYSYLFTGENTEVITFEMTYDNQYYIITSPSTNKDNASAKNKSGSTPTQTAGGTNSAPGSGELNQGDAIVENVRSNLYSIADQALATIRIMGDPDFLMDTIGHKIKSDTFSKFYGNNDSVNPYQGQVYIEIEFNMGEDYSHDDGLLDVDSNQTVLFYPPEIQKKLNSKGIIYKIISVDSSFSKGKFEQVLELHVPPLTDLILPDEDESNAERARLNRSGNIGNQNESEAETARLNRSGDRGDSESNNSDVRNSETNTDDIDPLVYMYDPESPSDSGDSSNSYVKPLVDTSSADDDASLPGSLTIPESTDDDRREDSRTQSSEVQSNGDAVAIRAAEESILTPPPGY